MKLIICKDEIGSDEETVKVIKCQHCGHYVEEYPFGPLGVVRDNDVGKMCKKVDGLWYVENKEQFEARTGG